jgi:hypothetical protein
MEIAAVGSLFSGTATLATRYQDRPPPSSGGGFSGGAWVDAGSEAIGNYG